jgi:hypothetical protein
MRLRSSWFYRVTQIVKSGKNLVGDGKKKNYMKSKRPIAILEMDIL